MKLETVRLRIVPLDAVAFQKLLCGLESLESWMGLTPSGERMDGETRMAMEWLYQQGREHPEEFIWYTSWAIILKEKNMVVGSACFKGMPDEYGTVELGYGIYPSFRRRGFMKEAAGSLVRWALEQPGVAEVAAETDCGNFASQKVLESCGLCREGRTEGGILWKVNRKSGINPRPGAGQRL